MGATPSRPRSNHRNQGSTVWRQTPLPSHGYLSPVNGQGYVPTPRPNYYHSASVNYWNGPGTMYGQTPSVTYSRPVIPTGIPVIPQGSRIATPELPVPPFMPSNATRQEAWFSGSQAAGNTSQGQRTSRSSKRRKHRRPEPMVITFSFGNNRAEGMCIRFS